MGIIEKRLEELGLALPDPRPPVGNYAQLAQICGKRTEPWVSVPIFSLKNKSSAAFIHDTFQ